MAHSVKLHYGADKRNPTRTLDLVGTGTTDNIYLRQTGHSLAAGEQNILWNDGGGYRRHGARRQDSKRQNIELSLSFNLVGGSAATIEAVRQEISRFLEEARLYEEQLIGEPVWLEYRWHDSLNDISQPVFGQFSKFVRILSGDIERWPDNVHGGAIITGNVPNVVITLTCAPLWEGLQQVAGDCDDFPDSGADPDLYWTLSDSEITDEWCVAGWITHTEADYVVFEYYVDSNNYVRVEWDESDGRFEIVRNVAGSPTTYNGTSQTLSEGDEVHIALAQNGSNQLLFVNGDQDDSDTTNTWSSGGVFSLGWATSIGTAANCAGLDGWRVWDDDLTVTQIGYLYDNEVEVKNAGLTIGRPTYLYTKDGDAGIDAVDGIVSAAAKDNFCVVGWVGGDVEAKAKWTFDPPASGTTIRGFYLNRNAQDSTFTPLASSFLDFSGTADVGTSSGDAYEASGATFTHDFDASVTSPEAIRGDVTIVGRIVEASVQSKVWPYIKYGLSQKVLASDSTSLIRSGSFRLRELGTLRIDWPDETTTPPTMTAGLSMEAYSESTLLTDLVAAYSMNESAGPRYDLVGSNHLTEVSTVSATSGAFLNCAVFSGSDYLFGPGTGQLSMSDDFSISAWVYVGADTTGYICGKWGGVHEYRLIYSDVSQTFVFSVTANGSTDVNVVCSTSPISLTTWYHVYCYHDVGTEIGISLNNGAAATQAHTGGQLSGIENFAVGADSIGSTNFTGRVDLLHIRRRLLTSAERTTNYNAGSALPYPFTATSVSLDFINILTEPLAKVEGDWPTLASGDTVAIEGKKAWVEDASDSDSQLQHLNFSGNEVTVAPQKYNYISLLLGADGDIYTVTNSITNFKAYITPRWTLPGGAVA